MRTHRRLDIVAKLMPLHEPLSKFYNDARTPAVVDTASGTVISHRFLAQLARSYASELDRMVPVSDAPVPILLQKGWEQVAAVFAVLMSGRAYVPLSTSWPGARLRQIVEAVKGEVIITTEATMAMVSNAEVLSQGLVMLTPMASGLTLTLIRTLT